MNKAEMEKQQEANRDGDTDSMTTVTVKDFNPVDYQEPLPAYRPKTSPIVQVAKIVAIAAVAIAGMLSFAIVFSAWLTNSSCQHQLQQLQKHQHLQQQQLLAHHQQQPSFEALIQPENLKNLLSLGSVPAASSLRKDAEKELDSAESKTRAGDTNKVDEDSSSSSEEDEENNSGEDGVTMLKLPVELSFQENMFERNHRSHMNCVIEKKKAEEIVDEQAKALPPLLGINMSTDPRYLHFTGEKMAISCDSGNDHPQPPTPRHHMPPPPPSPYHPHHPHHPQGPPQGGFEIPLMIDGMMVPPPPSSRHPHHHPSSSHPMPLPFSSSPFERDSRGSPVQSLASAIAAASSSSVPIQIIGPIPLSSGRDSESSGGLGLSSQMIPLLFGGQSSILEDLPLSPSSSPGQGNSERLSPLESLLLGPLFGSSSGASSSSSQDMPPPPPLPHHVLHYQPSPPQQNSPQQHAYHHSSIEFNPFLSQNPSQSSSSSAYSHPFQFSSSLGGPSSHVAPQSAEIRERAVPHPIPIMPRAHVQHVIRPRSVDALVKKRVKRCSCDCACKNHQE